MDIKAQTGPIKERVAYAPSMELTEEGGPGYDAHKAGIIPGDLGTRDPTGLVQWDRGPVTFCSPFALRKVDNLAQMADEPIEAYCRRQSADAEERARKKREILAGFGIHTELATTNPLEMNMAAMSRGYQQKKEEKMKPIKVEDIKFVAGNPLRAYSAQARNELLKEHENEVKRLESLEFKTLETVEEIAALRDGIVDAIAAFDQDYLARKAKTATPV